MQDQRLQGATILQVIPSLDTGGAENTTVEVSAAIVRAGGRSIVVSHGGRLTDRIRKDGGFVIEMPVHSKNPIAIARNALRIAGLIREHNIDLVHARSRAPAWSALAATRIGDKPFVTTYHGAYAAQSAIKKFYNSSMVRADTVIANSQFTADAITAQFNGSLAPKELVVIPRGADVSRFSPAAVSPKRRMALIEKWGVSQRDPEYIALLPARLSGWKGHMTILTTLDALRRRISDGKLVDGDGKALQVIFAGDADPKSEFAASIARRIDDLGLNHVVKMVGYCADMPAAYSVSDVVLVPSTRPEAFGRTVVEAGAMGKIVLASDHGGARETVDDGVSGFLLAPGDANAWAEQLRRVMNLSLDSKKTLENQALSRVRANFSIAAMCTSTISVYQKLLMGCID